MKRLTGLVLTAIMLGSAGVLSAKVAEGWYFSQDVGLQFWQNGVNGLQLDTKVFYRLPLNRNADTNDILFGSMKIDFGIHNMWTPSDEMISVDVNIEPIALFDITLRAGVFYMFNWLGYGFIQVSGYSVSMDSTTNASYVPGSVPGCWLQAVPEFKIQVGPVIFTSSFTVNYMSLFGYAGYYLERHAYVIQAASDFNMASDSSLLYEFKAGGGRVLWGLNFNDTFVPASGKSYIRPSVVFVCLPDFGNYDFYFANITGYGLTINQLYAAFAAGISFKL